MQKVNMIRALTLPVASAFALAACAPQMATMAPVKTENAAATATANQAQPAAQVPAAGTVSGLVKSYNEGAQRFEPVAGAVVKLDGTNLTATTDAEGRYQLAGVPAGAQNLTVTKAGFSAGTGRLVANSVMGLAGVNVALQRASYGLKAAGPSSPAARTIQVSGVVSDPRGVALPAAELTVTTTSGTISSTQPAGVPTPSPTPTTVGAINTPSSATAAARITADPAGFYAVPVWGALGEAQLRLQAEGTTPGGLELDMPAPVDSPIIPATGASSTALVQSLQTTRYTEPGTPSSAGGDMIPGEDFTISLTSGLSSQPDEFFIRIQDGTNT
jgi:hypothetical protein